MDRISCSTGTEGTSLLLTSPILLHPEMTHHHHSSPSLGPEAPFPANRSDRVQGNKKQQLSPSTLPASLARPPARTNRQGVCGLRQPGQTDRVSVGCESRRSLRGWPVPGTGSHQLPDQFDPKGQAALPSPAEWLGRPQRESHHGSLRNLKQTGGLMAQGLKEH